MTRSGAPADDVPMALLLAPPLSSAGEVACFGHLSTGGSPPIRSLSVLFTGRPEHRIRGWEDHVGERPDSTVVVASQPPSGPLEGVEVEFVDDPRDLSGLGVTLTDHLSRWPAAERTAFCLDSVTALLQYVDEEQAVRFLDALRGHLEERGVVGHVHMNPGAHEEGVVATFEDLADAVITVDADGGAPSGT